MQLTTKTLIRMHKASKIFKGNVRRLQAYCLMEELAKQTQSGNGSDIAEITTNGVSEKEERRECKEIEIEDCLVRALQSFE